MAGNFYKVKCPDCENEQVVFGKASTEVSCAVCGVTLATPTGGKAEFEGEVLDVVENRTAEAQ
ncbi:30S ribosomal protein S27e [Natranaeroarchaeum aerophilus]|uniref:Small ribosomal subunit protein eS27 n=1 Tax=Natranaeroarchaeum aerophilus TaxID=2917711 RepID=A0AAE3FTI3_9EURY|nr:30S ribosomal protein S27e [Natranaeroarchaeum aerophilus]MCL9814881.1 30S ribosomal protein S27e [Natranaeroarchaeum aerophilus]